MSKNNQAIAHQYSNLYSEIKKVDINALRSFMHSTTADIVDAIEYWKKRRMELIGDQNTDQRNLISIEIMRLESLMLARTRITMDFFNVEEDNGVRSDSEIISKDLASDNKPSGDTGLPMGPKEADKAPTPDAKETAGNASTTTKEKDNAPQAQTSKKEEAKIITMVPDKIKMNDLQEKVKTLLVEGKGDEALALATKYLAAGKYVPTKANSKPEKWFDARIKSWIVDLTRTIKPASIKNSAEKVTPVTTTKDKNAQSEVKDGQPSITAKENAGDAPLAKTGIKEKREGEIDVYLDPWDKFNAWAKEKEIDLTEWFDEEEISKANELYSCITFGTKDIDGMIEDLTKNYGLRVEETIEKPEDGGSTNFFENQTDSLNEEIQLIEDLLNQCHKLRGDVPNKPENMEEIKKLITDFFSTRDKEDYPEQDKLLSTISGRPTLLKTAKDFFSMISYPKVSLLTEKNAEGKDEINLYNKVISEIESDLSNLKAGDEEGLTNLEDQYITRLRGKILGGKGEKDKNVSNKTTFYTQYHVLDFIEQIMDKKLTGVAPTEDKDQSPVNLPGEENASATSESSKTEKPVSTIPAAGASEKQTGKTNSKDAKPKLHECKNIEEALMLTIKNGGKLEDALVHPFCEALKNTEVQDPDGPNKITLNDENYAKYVSKKFDVVLATYKANLTTYPVEELAKLVSIAISEGKSPEDFAKENIDLVKKNDKEFLSITGELGDVKSTVLIKSEEDFLNYVKEIYEIEKKTKDEAPDLTKYEVSSIKSFKDFETQVLKNVSEKKMKLDDLKKWAREEVVNKTFELERDKLPAFTSENINALDTYLEVITKKFYQTPESRANDKAKVQEYTITLLTDPKINMMIYGIVGEAKKFCMREAIDYNLKDLLEDVLKLAEVHNKPIFDKYVSNKAAMEKSGLITKKTSTIPTGAPEDKKAVIKETTEGDGITNDNVKAIFAETKEVTTEEGLRKVLDKYRDYPAAILRAATFLISSQKQIKDMKMNDAAVNTWVMNFLKEKTDTPEPEKTEKDKSKAKDDAVIDFSELDFDNLKFSSDKKKFRENLDKICSTYEDSSKLREQIIKAIQTGEGARTRVVAKNTVIDINKMIKKAFERVENAANREKLD